MIKKLWLLKFDLFLILVALVGAYLALLTGIQRASLTAHVNRIEKRIGTFKITDPTLVQIQAVETDNPLEFAWRIYLPANYSTMIVQSFDSAGSDSNWSTNVNPTEFIANNSLEMDQSICIDDAILFRSPGFLAQRYHPLPNRTVFCCGSNQFANANGIAIEADFRNPIRTSKSCLA